MIKVRVQETYKGSGKGGIVTGYLVYAYEGNPLLGEIKNTRQVFRDKDLRKAKKNADRYASGLRAMAKQNWL